MTRSEPRPQAPCASLRAWRASLRWVWVRTIVVMLRLCSSRERVQTQPFEGCGARRRAGAWGHAIADAGAGVVSECTVGTWVGATVGGGGREQGRIEAGDYRTGQPLKGGAALRFGP
jgi:hypothetical protein